ncbi:MAG: UMP kinase, partial [Pseudomonadota bacterium]
ARDNALPIVVFSLHEEGGLTDVLFGRGRYTRVGP